MKLTQFFKNAKTAIKGLINKGKEVITGPKPQLCYQRLISRAARVRFSPQSNAAAARRYTRDQVLKGVRRNTLGLPVGIFSRIMRACDLKRLGTIFRFNALTKEWKRAPHLYAEQAQITNDALKVGSELRKLKRGKMESKILPGRMRLSCHPMKAMVDIMERRDQLGRGTDNLGITQPAVYVSARADGEMDATRQAIRGRLTETAMLRITGQHPTLARKDRRAAARTAAKVIFRNQRGLPSLQAAA